MYLYKCFIYYITCILFHILKWNYIYIMAIVNKGVIHEVWEKYISL